MDLYNNVCFNETREQLLSGEEDEVMVIPLGRLLSLFHSLSQFLHPPQSTECLYRECVHRRFACCCSSSRWRHLGCCVEAGQENKREWSFSPISVSDTDIFIDLYNVYLFCICTSSARKRSLSRKFCTSLSLSLTVCFFTWVRICRACWPMLSCEKRDEEWNWSSHLWIVHTLIAFYFPQNLHWFFIPVFHLNSCSFSIPSHTERQARMKYLVFILCRQYQLSTRRILVDNDPCPKHRILWCIFFHHCNKVYSAFDSSHNTFPLQVLLEAPRQSKTNKRRKWYRTFERMDANILQGAVRAREKVLQKLYYWAEL